MQKEECKNCFYSSETFDKKYRACHVFTGTIHVKTHGHCPAWKENFDRNNLEPGVGFALLGTNDDMPG